MGVTFQSRANDLKFALGLTQLAIKYYDSNFWNKVDSALGVTTSPKNRERLGELYIGTLKCYDLFQINIYGSNKYVENIKANAFVTNNFMSGRYDFWEAYYEYCLFRQIDDFSDEDMQSLSDFMQSTINNSSDDSITAGGVKAKKSCRLLRSTRRVLARCDSEAVRDRMRSTLEMLDNYYYDDKLPNGSGRFENEFGKWCKAKANAAVDGQFGAVGKRERRLVSHSPYLKVDFQNETAWVVIPRQRFRKNEINSSAYFTVSEDGGIGNGIAKETHRLSLTESFGMYTSEEEEIPIESIFSCIEIKIDQKPTVIFKDADYRIFTVSSNDIVSSKHMISDRECEVLVKKSCDISHNEGIEDITIDEDHDCWNVLSVRTDDNTIVFIDDIRLSTKGSLCETPHFMGIINGFSVKTTFGDQIPTVSEHPIMNFSCSVPQLDGLVITVSGGAQTEKFYWTEIADIAETEEYDGRVQVSIDLAKLLVGESGRYDIKLDIPGKKEKITANTHFLWEFRSPQTRKFIPTATKCDSRRAIACG